MDGLWPQAILLNPNWLLVSWSVETSVVGVATCSLCTSPCRNPKSFKVWTQRQGAQATESVRRALGSTLVSTRRIQVNSDAWQKSLECAKPCNRIHG